MNVEILNVSTEKPLSLIGSVAGVSHGKEDGSVKRALNCWRMGHTSVLEHVSVTWHVDGISRACSHQLVRHRLASFCQLSQRYTKLDTEGEDWYVTPAAFAERGLGAKYKQQMRTAGLEYECAMRAGVKPEDARCLLPEATKTSVNVTMNLREFVSFYRLRSDKSAQWEIRELAHRMLAGLAHLEQDEWTRVYNVIASNEVF